MTANEKPVFTRVPVEPGSRIEQLAAAYDELKARFDEAQRQFEACKDALKFEMAAAAPDKTHLVASAGAVVLELTYGETWRVDAKALKEKDPLLYAAYAKQSGSWTLRRAKA